MKSAPVAIESGSSCFSINSSTRAKHSNISYILVKRWKIHSVVADLCCFWNLHAAAYMYHCPTITLNMILYRVCYGERYYLQIEHLINICQFCETIFASIPTKRLLNLRLLMVSRLLICICTDSRNFQTSNKRGRIG